jgi:hypothetical protein
MQYSSREHASHVAAARVGTSVMRPSSSRHASACSPTQSHDECVPHVAGSGKHSARPGGDTLQYSLGLHAHASAISSGRYDWQ